MARDLDRVGKASAPYLLDLQCELARASGEVTSLRELAQHLSEANLLLRDFRQNAIVKRVTSWAAIIAVPTLVTGYYGMNVPYFVERDVGGDRLDRHRAQLLRRVVRVVQQEGLALTSER